MAFRPKATHFAYYIGHPSPIPGAKRPVAALCNRPGNVDLTFDEKKVDCVPCKRRLGHYNAKT